MKKHLLFFILIFTSQSVCLADNKPQIEDAVFDFKSHSTYNCWSPFVESSIYGKVSDLETGKGIADVRLNLKGLTRGRPYSKKYTSTKRGCFYFGESPSI